VPTRAEDGSAGHDSLPWERIGDYRCFGCSPRNEHGLALRMRETQDGLATSFTFRSWHESYPGIAHGGLVGAVMDELMGNLLALRLRRLALTTNFRAKFLAPIRIGRPYLAVARVLRSNGALWQLESEILDEAGQIVAMGKGSYSVMTAEQAAREMVLPEADLRAFDGYFARGGSGEGDGARDD
jgi:acyl-coenzyme A thioesterase PaaI-like protein